MVIRHYSLVPLLPSLSGFGWLCPLLVLHKRKTLLDDKPKLEPASSMKCSDSEVKCTWNTRISLKNKQSNKTADSNSNLGKQSEGYHLKCTWNAHILHEMPTFQLEMHGRHLPGMLILWFVFFSHLCVIIFRVISDLDRTQIAWFRLV